MQRRGDADRHAGKTAGDPAAHDQGHDGSKTPPDARRDPDLGQTAFAVSEIDRRQADAEPDEVEEQLQRERADGTGDDTTPRDPGEWRG